MTLYKIKKTFRKMVKHQKALRSWKTFQPQATTKTVTEIQDAGCALDHRVN